MSSVQPISEPKYGLKKKYENYIGGQWVAPTDGEYFENISPVNGKTMTMVPRSQAADIERALDAAHEAAPAWGKTSVTERSSILMKIADRMEQNLEMLATVETWDNGKAIRETMAADLPLAIDHFRYFAGVIRAEAGEVSNIDANTVTMEVHEPLGVVGQIIPWNFPILMATWKLAPALAAGNCVVLKPAEQTPASILVLAELIEDLLPPGVINIVNGFGPEAGKPLASSPRIGKIAFTGETTTGRLIMQYASENIIPVTLELGGKSPVVVGVSADIAKVALRTMTCKTLNAGQICLAPDYVLLPEGKQDEFVAAARAAVETMYPSGVTRSDDYTAVINERHRDRLQAYANDARDKGAKIVELDAGESSADSPFRMPPALVLDPVDEMQVMQDEIFGPLLPVMAYSDIEEVIAYINARPRPLAVYYFGDDAAEQDRILTETVSGGATINDVLFHIAQEDLPFGGIGPSGMGCYHGKDGFDEFSHRKAVYTQTRADLLSVLRPPYGEKFRKLMESRLKH